jgi:hypothetical protein
MESSLEISQKAKDRLPYDPVMHSWASTQTNVNQGKFYRRGSVELIQQANT